jgi:sugar phosphate isomerase/epimerase
VRAAGRDLAHIHVQDADGYADRHWLPGEGTIHWHSVFAALKETGATPRLVIEPNANNRQSIRDGADWMIAQGFVR